MTKSQSVRRRSSARFETASALTLGRARVRKRAKPRHSPFARSPFAIRHSLFFLLVVMIVGLLWLTLDDRFYIYHADVVGAGRVTPEQVFRASGLQGLHVLWVRPAQVEAGILAQLPALESAQVACGLLDEGCTITVVERQPRVMWNDEEGQSWWIDSGGVVFPAGAEVSEGWVVEGALPRDEQGQLDERVRVALAELWSLGADVPQPFYYLPGRGLMYTAGQGYRVILGQGAGMGERLRVLDALAADLEARGVTPLFVDVRLPQAPYYSLTNEW